MLFQVSRDAEALDSIATSLPEILFATTSCLIHIRFSNAKKTYGYRQRDEAKRSAFIAQLADIPLSQPVYVDESGMDERDDYGFG